MVFLPEIVNWSFIAVLGFAVAVLSLAIMLIISHKQQEQTDELQEQGEKIDGTTEKIEKTTKEIHETTREIKKVQKEQQRLLTGVQDVYASAFVEYIQSVSKSFDHELGLYRKFLSYEETFSNSENSQRRKNFRNSIISNYDNILHTRRPKLDFIDIVRSFGRELANKYWRNTPKLAAQDWSPYEDYGLALLIYSFKEEMFNMVILKDDFLEFCHATTQDNDSNYLENYEKIKGEWKIAKKPKENDYDDGFVFDP